MAVPRRRKKQTPLPPLEYPPGFNEKWVMEWFEWGWRNLVAYMESNLAFDRFYDARPQPEDEQNALD